MLKNDSELLFSSSVPKVSGLDRNPKLSASNLLQMPGEYPRSNRSGSKPEEIKGSRDSGLWHQRLTQRLAEKHRRAKSAGGSLRSGSTSPSTDLNYLLYNSTFSLSSAATDHHGMSQLHAKATKKLEKYFNDTHSNDSPVRSYSSSPSSPKLGFQRSSSDSEIFVPHDFQWKQASMLPSPKAHLGDVETPIGDLHVPKPRRTSGGSHERPSPKGYANKTPPDRAILENAFRIALALPSDADSDNEDEGQFDFRPRVQRQLSMGTAQSFLNSMNHAMYVHQMKEGSCSPSSIRRLILENGSVPNEIRLKAWFLMLMGKDEAELTAPRKKSRKGGFKLQEEHTMRMDIERTCPEDPLFRSKKAQKMCSNILLEHCVSTNVPYKQGMNEVVAPFVALELNTPALGEEKMVLVYTALIERFVPLLQYSDRLFGLSLRASLAFFRLLLRYFDPTLTKRLEECQIGFDYIATSWMLTLFAHKWGMNEIYTLWDQYLAVDDPCLHHFFCTALILSKRQKLMAAPEESLLQEIGTELINSRPPQETLLPLVEQAKCLRERMPSSFREMLLLTCFSPLSKSPQHTQTLEKLVPALEVAPVCPIQAWEVAAFLASVGLRAGMLSNEQRGILNKISGISTRRFTLIDCRSTQDFKACHISFSIHFAPESLETTTRVLEKLKSFKESHLCLIGGHGRYPFNSEVGTQELESDEVIDVYRVAETLINEGFKKISFLADSFEASIKALQFLCFDGAKLKDGQRQFFFSMFTGEKVNVFWRNSMIS